MELIRDLNTETIMDKDNVHQLIDRIFGDLWDRPRRQEVADAIHDRAIATDDPEQYGRESLMLDRSFTKYPVSVEEIVVEEYRKIYFRHLMKEGTL